MGDCHSAGICSRASCKRALGGNDTQAKAMEQWTSMVICGGHLAHRYRYRFCAPLNTRMTAAVIDTTDSAACAFGIAPNNGFNNNEQISNCLSSYYNSKGGKILEFGSLLSMVPGWDPEPGKNILENIFLMGGKLIGLKGLQTVGQAGIQS